MTLDRISADNARKLQEFADEFQVTITVVGSRVDAGKSLTPGVSDWDFKITKIEGVEPTRSMRDIKKKAGIRFQRVEESRTT